MPPQRSGLQCSLPSITFVASEDEAKATPRGSALIVASMVERLGITTLAGELDMGKHHGLGIEHMLLIFLLFSAYGATSVTDLRKKAEEDTALAEIMAGVGEIEEHVLRYYRGRHDVMTLESLLGQFIGSVQHTSRFESRKDGVLALDDSTIEKFGKNMEHIAVVYEHCEKRYCLGYVVVSTCYCDADKLYPVNFQFRIQTEEERRRAEDAKLKKKAGVDFRTKGALVDWLQVLEDEGRLPSIYSLVGKLVTVENFQELDARSLPWVAAAHERLPLRNINGERAWGWADLKRKTLANKPDISATAGLRFYTKEVSLHQYGPEVDFVVVTDLAGQEVDHLILQRVSHKERVVRILQFFEREGEPEASKLHIGVDLIRRAKEESSIKAETVAADAWFFVVWFVKELLGVSGIKRVVSKLKIDQLVLFRNEWLRADELWKIAGLKFRHERKKHFKWAKLKVGVDGLGLVQVVLVQELDEKRPWRIIAEYIVVCTDAEWPPLKVVAAYKLRWGIEVFYRAAKQRFGMTQFHDENFVAIHFHMTFVFLGYLMTAVLRQITPGLHDRTLGEIIDLYLRAHVRIKKKGNQIIVFVGPRFAELFGIPSLAQSP